MMNDNVAVKANDEVILAEVVVDTGEILTGVENLVCEIGRKLYGYDMAQKNDEQVNCMEQALVSNRERLAEICNKLEVIDRRL
nr:MAG TPA: hypothetical protein [Caudoviricetes sp.]